MAAARSAASPKDSSSNKSSLSKHIRCSKRLVKGHYMRRIQSLENSPNKTKFPHTTFNTLGAEKSTQTTAKSTNPIGIQKPVTQFMIF
jgi:hypothetical protein